MRRQITRRVRAISRAIIDPPWQPDGHYYSPSPSADDVSRALGANRLTWDGVDLNPAGQCDLAALLEPDIRHWPPPSTRWRPNGMYNKADASILWAMLHHLQPARIVEVGSGWSTAVSIDYGQADIVAVEPYPDRLNSILADGDPVTVIDRPVQQVDMDVLTGADLLFIDSTHVAKAGSDVTWLLLEVLPRLPVGTWVHIHDILWPDYPASWLHERRGWNEAYMVQAMLAGEGRWSVRLFGSWLQREGPWRQMWPGVSSGSLWIERVA